MSAIAWNAVRDGHGVTVRHQWNVHVQHSQQHSKTTNDANPFFSRPGRFRGSRPVWMWWRRLDGPAHSRPVQHLPDLRNHRCRGLHAWSEDHVPAQSVWTRTTPRTLCCCQLRPALLGCAYQWWRGLHFQADQLRGKGECSRLQRHWEVTLPSGIPKSLRLRWMVRCQQAAQESASAFSIASYISSSSALV